MAKVVIMFDLDGTLFDTMGAHADLAADVMAKHLGLSKKSARNKYLATAGVPFPKQLELIFPNAKSAQRNACEQEYVERKMIEVYGGQSLSEM